MKTPPYLLLFLMITTLSFAQEVKKDSIKKEVFSIEEDTILRGTGIDRGSRYYKRKA